MKRYLLKSQGIKGHVEVIYNMSGVLHRLDFANATASRDQIKNYKFAIPVMAENIYEQFKEKGVHVEEAEFEVTFQDFMREYGYKRNTHLAAKVFPLLTSGEQYKAFVEAIEYRKYCERNASWGYKPMLPEKWLKTKQFLNEWSKL